MLTGGVNRFLRPRANPDKWAPKLQVRHAGPGRRPLLALPPNIDQTDLVDPPVPHLPEPLASEPLDGRRQYGYLSPINPFMLERSGMTTCIHRQNQG